MDSTYLLIDLMWVLVLFLSLLISFPFGLSFTSGGSRCRLLLSYDTDRIASLFCCTTFSAGRMVLRSVPSFIGTGLSSLITTSCPGYESVYWPPNECVPQIKHGPCVPLKKTVKQHGHHRINTVMYNILKKECSSTTSMAVSKSLVCVLPASIYCIESAVGLSVLQTGRKFCGPIVLN